MKILLIEDEILMADELKEQLLTIGYSDVIHCINEKEAIEQFSLSRPDLLIVDIGLKGSDLDGIDLAIKLHKIQSVPTIFLSAFSDQSTLERIKSVEFANYLVKPSSTRQLFVSIDLAISSYANNSNLNNNINLESPSCPLYARHDHFFIKGVTQAYEKVDVNSVIWIEAVRGGVNVVTNKKNYMLTASLSSFTEQFVHADLVRVHRSYIINVKKIQSLKEREFILNYNKSTESIPCSKPYWKNVKNQFLKLKSD